MEKRGEECGKKKEREETETGAWRRRREDGQIVGREYGKYGRKKGEEEDQRALEVEDEEEGQR